MRYRGCMITLRARLLRAFGYSPTSDLRSLISASHGSHSPPILVTQLRFIFQDKFTTYVFDGDIIYCPRWYGARRTPQSTASVNRGSSAFLVIPGRKR